VLRRRQLSAPRLVLAGLVVGALALWAPAAAMAHSELESADPAANSTVAESPTLIVANFTEKVDASRSSMELRGADGAVIAKGGVAPGDPEAVQMTVEPPAPLAPGTYEIRWTTVTADDNGIERGTYTITVAAAPTPAPTQVPPSATPEESEAPTESEDGEGSEAPEASATESAAPSEAPTVSASPSGTGGSTGGAAGGGPDVLVVGGVAVVLLLVVIGAGVYVARSRRA
jgi:methionine-rich copper-binding protein CopC